VFEAPGKPVRGEAFLGLAAAFEPTYQLRRLTDSVGFALSL
jgi:hypothetical protein